MDKQVTSTPPPPPKYLEMGGGGSGYLYLHYWPPVDWEPAINVDMVNTILFVYCLIDSLRPINNLSVEQGPVFLGWTSTKLG